MATLTHNGALYTWSGTFDERLLPKEAGFRWNPETRQWWTNDSRKAAALAAYADGAARAALTQRETALAASRATNNTEIEIPCPGGLAYLPYQKAGIAYAAQRTNALIADEMGLGKTIQALGLINLKQDIRTVLVIAPKSTLLNWQREAERWLVREVELVTINYDMISKRPELMGRVWDLVVLDESQYVKNPKAKRTKAALAVPASRRLFLTGTPILNRPVELWPTLEKIDPAGLGRNFFGFAKRYCGARQIRAGRKLVWDFSGSSNLGELQERMRTAFMVRRLKADVLTELPAKRRQIIPLEANGAARLLAAEQRLIEKMGFDEAARMLTGEVPGFTEMSAVRHEIGVAKIEKALDHITDALENVGKVIVFAHHQDVVAGLVDGLRDVGAVSITGQTSAEARQQAVDAFQSDPDIRVFVGNIKAAGVGITLTAASTVIFVEQDWTPGWMQQAEDRAHRIGQTESVLVQYLVFDGSLDAHMAHTLVDKDAVCAQALDDPNTVADLSEIEAAVAEKLAKRERLERERGFISSVHMGVIQRNLRLLAGRCDGAQELDGAGFNKLDSRFGKELAQWNTLSLAQAHAARQMLVKYSRQLGDDAVRGMFE